MLLEHRKADEQMTLADFRRLQSITEEWGNTEKKSQMSYLSSQRYLYITQRSLEYEKVDEWMSTDIETDHRTHISQKMWKRKAL